MGPFRFLASLAVIVAFASQMSDGKGVVKRSEISDGARDELRKAGLRYMRAYYGREDQGKSVSLPPVPSSLEAAMLKLQETAGLEQTGKLDEPTVRAMTWPRCGVNDTIEVDVTEEGERKRRYVVSGPSYKWTTTDLTYKIENYPDTSISIITHDEVDEAISRAFELWAEVTPLTFTRVLGTTPADIVLSFGKRKHTTVFGDPAFDGPGGTLAHAFSPNSGWGPLNGDVHYDDAETFTHKKYYGRSLLYVSAHEVGHSLGLDHSNTKGALMWPFILSYRPNYKLPEDDKLGIQAIYGTNPNTPEPELEPTTQPPPTTPMPAPAYCNMIFDDVAILRGEIFAFKGKKFWRFSNDGHLINAEEGTSINSFFQNTPKTLNAICERWHDDTILFVKGRKIHEVSGQQLDQVSSRDLTELSLPKPMDAVMHRASEGITYYIKKKLVFKYDEFEGALTGDSPLKIHKAFSGIPKGTRVNAAFTGIDGYNYLLVGTQYYQVDPHLNSTGILSDFGQDFLLCPQP